LRETDIWRKDQEFRLYVEEIKKVNPEQLSNWEKKIFFKDFMEDFNTCTMPSKKFYNLEKFEQKEAKRRNQRLMKDAKKQEKVKIKDLDNVQTTFNDEEELRLQRKREREKKEKQAYQDKIFEATLNAANKEKDSMLKILGVVSEKDNKH